MVIPARRREATSAIAHPTMRRASRDSTMRENIDTEDGPNGAWWRLMCQINVTGVARDFSIPAAAAVLGGNRTLVRPRAGDTRAKDGHYRVAARSATRSKPLSEIFAVPRWS